MSYQDKFWTAYFRYYDVLLELIPYQKLMNELVKSLDIKKDDRILDIGCGTANILYFTSAKDQFTGFDQSSSALKRAKHKFPILTIREGSIGDALPFQSNEFDKLVTNNVLYTIPKSEWSSVIAECKRIIKPGGRIVISNLNSTFKPIDIYKAHIKEQINQKGLAKTLVNICRLIIPTVQVLRYNKIISKSNSLGSYHFLQNGEQSDAFLEQGFTKIQDSKLVYANQAILDVFCLE